MTVLTYDQARDIIEAVASLNSSNILVSIYLTIKCPITGDTIHFSHLSTGRIHLERKGEYPSSEQYKNMDDFYSYYIDGQ